MNFRELINRSISEFEKSPEEIQKPFSIHVFDSGAKWMYAKMRQGIGKKEFNNQVNYNYYGFLKYGICLLGFGISIFLLWEINWMLVPFSIFVFYVLEVHFLFLFPLLIDAAKKPLSASIRLTYKIGLLKCVFTVMAIGFFMVLGFLNIKHPLRNWYIGCLSIVIWYQYEIGNRV